MCDRKTTYELKNDIARCVEEHNLKRAPNIPVVQLGCQLTKKNYRTLSKSISSENKNSQT